MQQTADRPVELLTTAEAASYLRTTPGTLTTWRCTKARTIPYIKRGRSVLYRRRDLDAWLDAQTVDAQVAGGAA